jgi:hypothetical protein
MNSAINLSLQQASVSHMCLPVPHLLLQLCLLGSEDSVYSSSTTLDIAGGQLSLPAITPQPAWFTAAASKGSATLVLLEDEPGPVAGPAAAGSSSQQQWQGWGQDHQPQKELGRIHLRLAPAAEELRVMAAGPLFEKIVLTLEGKQGGVGRGKRRQQQGNMDVRLVNVGYCLGAQVQCMSLRAETCLSRRKQHVLADRWQAQLVAGQSTPCCAGVSYAFKATNTVGLVVP